jgi:hypothetical protein
MFRSPTQGSNKEGVVGANLGCVACRWEVWLARAAALEKDPLTAWGGADDGRWTYHILEERWQSMDFHSLLPVLRPRGICKFPRGMALGPRGML